MRSAEVLSCRTYAYSGICLIRYAHESLSQSRSDIGHRPRYACRSRRCCFVLPACNYLSSPPILGFHHILWDHSPPVWGPDRSSYVKKCCQVRVKPLKVLCLELWACASTCELGAKVIPWGKERPLSYIYLSGLVVHRCLCACLRYNYVLWVRKMLHKAKHLLGICKWVWSVFRTNTSCTLRIRDEQRTLMDQWPSHWW